MIGMVIGLVSAAAGIAGFAGPLLMAFSFSRYGGYGPALALITFGSALATAHGLIHIRRTRPSDPNVHEGPA
jgi:nitrate/nitrite transporter NarK